MCCLLYILVCFCQFFDCFKLSISKFECSSLQLSSMKSVDWKLCFFLITLHVHVVFSVLSPCQTTATSHRNISQRCWVQHVACVWPPCCHVLRHVRYVEMLLSFGRGFIPECSRVKQDDQATSNIWMAASAKSGRSIFTGDIFFCAKFKILGIGMGW